ncbi:hypothetical protein C0Q70_17165 [Pomacea canaliculata]|uniref:Uncharacterized protein n=1 Tax=Pomacea canaliculata TaxID=400727 RepID=A0A2T7NRT9_POMCA|nr:hypothetical protein C0Q70_17165 [Pomacea canaliculata]
MGYRTLESIRPLGIGEQETFRFWTLRRDRFRWPRLHFQSPGDGLPTTVDVSGAWKGSGSVFSAGRQQPCESVTRSYNSYSRCCAAPAEAEELP